MQKVEIIKKNIKHIYIRIKPPENVVVSVPYKTKQKTIDNLLQQKAQWIERQLRSLGHHTPQNLEYIDGDKLYFLGNAYKLELHPAPHTHIQIHLDTLKLYTSNSKEHRAQIVEQWYYTQAKIYFDKAIAKYQPIVNRPIHAVRIKKMKTRWGSCNHTKGYINLNVELLKKPLEALEYVVFHELVHLIHPNHSRDFYDFIAQYMPDWKDRDKLLK
ncbi:MAG: SprT family zinc-dependent metalloprotease [Campylobacterota bacterium]|nr:SprT family zinc-dependent metalloprotease [Campylobacterota bacterium]